VFAAELEEADLELTAGELEPQALCIQQRGEGRRAPAARMPGQDRAHRLEIEEAQALGLGGDPLEGVREDGGYVEQGARRGGHGEPLMYGHLRRR